MRKKLLKLLAGLVLLAAAVVAAGAWWLFSSPAYQGPEPEGRLEHGSLEHRGKVRTWQTYAPSSLAGQPPVLFVLHGSMGSATQMRKASYRAFELLADREGLVIVYADGYENHWNDCRGGASYSANLENIDDVGFFRALVAVLEERYNADPRHVYATGLSNGGHMAFRLALEAPDLIAGIAPIAANLPVPDNMDCEPSGKAVATLIINGTEDPVNPYAGGLVDVFGETSRGHVLSSFDTARYWAALAGYSGAAQQQAWDDRAPDDGTTITSAKWSSPTGVSVGLITVKGGGHSVPNEKYRLPRILGRTSHEFTTAEVIWAFFSGDTDLR
ncbi:alpha/beta hydrolase family esterase [Haliea alexandrii]|uniref:alpha/beta hydrolase family esterase n=1 Tax=Haliea alexandrii TaxID=2448162 RepID=UPI001304AB6F|nr:PHB depolymerase family esterase [Haliea alexandrii]